MSVGARILYILPLVFVVSYVSVNVLGNRSSRIIAIFESEREDYYFFWNVLRAGRTILMYINTSPIKNTPQYPALINHGY